MINKNKPAGEAYKAKAVNAIEKRFSTDSRGHQRSAMYTVLEAKLQVEIDKIKSTQKVKKLHDSLLVLVKEMKQIERKLNSLGWEVDHYNNRLRLDSCDMRDKLWADLLSKVTADKRSMIAEVYAAETIDEVEGVVKKAEEYI